MLRLHDWIAFNMRGKYDGPWYERLTWYFWNFPLFWMELIFPSIEHAAWVRMEVDRQLHPERWDKQD